MNLRDESFLLPLKTLKIIVFFFSIILVFCFIFLKIKFNDAYTKIIQEDNLVENAECVVYFLSFLFAFAIAIDFIKTKQKLHGLFYLILSIIIIFICGEEISWGQRIFNIKSPGFFIEHNVQKEINLHNLDIVHYIIYWLYALVGFFGAFMWMILSRRDRYGYRLNYFVPGWFLTFYFIPAFLIYMYFCIYGFTVIFFGIEPFRIGNSFFIVWRDQEPAELLLAFGFLFFTVWEFIKTYHENTKF